jgi:uncharacterized membrane protein YvbJ
MWICPKFKCPNIDKMTKEMSYCPECGTKLKEMRWDTAKSTFHMKQQNIQKTIGLPEPQLKWWEVASIISGLILFIIPGLLLAMFYAWDLNKRKEAWRQERMIRGLENNQKGLGK